MLILASRFLEEPQIAMTIGLIQYSSAKLEASAVDSWSTSSSSAIGSMPILQPIAAYCNLHVHHVPELSRNWNQTGRWPKNEQPILMWKLDVSTPLPISIAFMDRCDKVPIQHGKSPVYSSDFHLTAGRHIRIILWCWENNIACPISP